MEDLIQRLRNWKKPSSKKSSHVDLDLASPTSESGSAKGEEVSRQKATKFQLKRPRWTSSDGLAKKEGPPQRHSLGSSAASSASSEVVVKGGPGSPFADEDDLFADRDDGVYMQSSSSSSPAASERLGGGGISRPNQPQRPASCTFSNNSFATNRTFLQTQGMQHLS